MSRSLVLTNSELIEKSVANNESELTHTGALLSLTGNRTGRSPKIDLLLRKAAPKIKSIGVKLIGRLMQIILINYGIRLITT